MKIIELYGRGYRSNTYFACTDSGECAIFDPGADIDDIDALIKKHSLTPKVIVLTHGHFDHILSLDLLREKYSIPVAIHENDNEMLTDSQKNAYQIFFGNDLMQRPADVTFKDGDIIPVGNEMLTVIHTPGHSKGSSCFITEKSLITGDTLFSSGIGRSDLYGGNSDELYTSLMKLKGLDRAEETTIYPGHGNKENLATAIKNVFY